MIHPTNNRRQLTNNEGIPSPTHDEQVKVEKLCINNLLKQGRRINELFLNRESHVDYLKAGLKELSRNYQSLDASKPWLCYWILHALELLNSLPGQNLINRTVSYLSHCQNPKGGFCGGPGQLPHLATTYAGVNTLVICGTQAAYETIHRKEMYYFLMSLKTSEGGFRMHEVGECDVRGTYCAMSVASLLNLMTPELTVGVAEWVASCQTYEGGFGGAPFNEAHGGYSFCGFATLVILGATHLIDKKAFMHWAYQRQMRVEGGFQGRSNKLVDGCYSFWQGGLYPLLDRCIINPEKYSGENNEKGRTIFDEGTGGWCFDQYALQEYLLACCQDPMGGLIDKPLKHRDYYHTCYCLSGMSVAQRNPHYYWPQEGTTVLGDKENLLEETDPIHNICTGKVAQAKEYFGKLPQPPFQ